MSTALPWQCRCPAVQPADKKRCPSCYAWQRSCIAFDDFTAAAAARKDKQTAVSDVGDGGDALMNLGEDGDEPNGRAGNARAYAYHRVSLEEAAAAGCEKCKKEHETGIKTTQSHDAGCPRKGKPRHKMTTLEEAAAQGCKKCEKEWRSGMKDAKSHDDDCPRRRGQTRNEAAPKEEDVECTKCKKQEAGKKAPGPHSMNCPKNARYGATQVTLEEAAAQGCKKCEKEWRTGVKDTKSHDDGCPRRRGPLQNSLGNEAAPRTDDVGFNKCKKQEAEKKVPGSSRYGANQKSNRPMNTLPEEGDPPWRCKGNSWIGRRLLYNPDALSEETRSCSKNKWYYVDSSHDNRQGTSSSAIKGTILGFISERDKDRNGMPGFVSEKTGLPAMLFHVAFDENPTLLNKDFEEWEIKEQCEWIHEETDSEDEGSYIQENDAILGGKSDAFEFDEEAPSPKENHVQSKRKQVQTNSSNRSETPIQGTAAAKTAVNHAIRCSNETGSRSINPHASSNEKERAASAANVTVRSTTAGTKSATHDFVTDSQHQNIAKPNLSECSSFNEALKSALSTYASNSAFRSSNNPPPPVPPPFLSHQEECTLRTALAFVMIKARNKKQKTDNSNPKIAIGAAKPASTGLSKQLGSNQAMTLGRATLGMTSGLNLPRQGAMNIDQRKWNDSFLGGLLSLPQRQRCKNTNRQPTANALLLFDREMNHIREILKLALSSVTPLYRGALEIDETNDLAVNLDDGQETDSNNASNQSNSATAKPQRQPSAVYDFEAGYNPLSTNNSKKSSVEHHYANLDGLCQHAATRLSRIINEVTVKSRLEQRASKAPKVQNEVPNKSLESEKQEGSIVTESSQGGDSSACFRNKKIFAEAIVKLFYDDLIGKAYLPNYFQDEERQSTTCRIEKIMSTCHVIHRLLYFDQANSFASECNIAISRTLADLYSSTYSGGSSGDISTTNQLAQTGKRKVQVVTPTWLANRTTYSDDRYERRNRGIDAMFRGQTSVSGGTKRKSAEPVEDDASNQHALPEVADVVTVNLLRLLECAAEMRLYHQSRMSLDQRNRSSSASDIINEIRFTNAIDLITPIHLEDSASFYLRESRLHRYNNAPSLLRPCAKLMLRVHFFGLVKKLSAFEQV